MPQTGRIRTIRNDRITDTIAISFSSERPLPETAQTLVNNREVRIVLKNSAEVDYHAFSADFSILAPR